MSEAFQLRHGKQLVPADFDAEHRVPLYHERNAVGQARSQTQVAWDQHSGTLHTCNLSPLDAFRVAWAQQDIHRGRGMVDSLFQGGVHMGGTQNQILSSEEYLSTAARTLNNIEEVRRDSHAALASIRRPKLLGRG